jgi:large subunit ribosomal protein L10
MAHVAKWKFGEVEKLTNLLTSNKIIGVAEIGGIPGPQLQKMRENIREKAQIRCAKNSLIMLALNEANKKVNGISELKSEIKGQAVIIATDMNPFKLFKEIKSTKTMAPAKGGETATHDIEVKKGDTPFKPGPVVGELQKAGIPAAIQEGKVVIKNDKVIVPAGNKIPIDVAQMLTRLEIYPLEIGMNLHAVFEGGTIYKPDVLDIDMDKFLIQLNDASLNALNVALEIAWPNKSTINNLLQKAYNNAHTLALEKNIYTKNSIGQFISRAYASMLSVASQAKDGLDDDLKKKLT